MHHDVTLIRRDVNNKSFALPDLREIAILEIIASRECKFGNSFLITDFRYSGCLLLEFRKTEGRRPLESQTRRYFLA